MTTQRRTPLLSTLALSALSAAALAGCSGGDSAEFCGAVERVEALSEQLETLGNDLGVALNSIDPEDPDANLDDIRSLGGDLVGLIDDFDAAVADAAAGTDEADVDAALDVVSAQMLAPMRTLGGLASEAEDILSFSLAVVGIQDELETTQGVEVSQAIETLDEYTNSTCAR